MVLVSNSEIMERFKEVERSNDYEKTKRIHDQIIKDLSFLVYNNTKKYKKFLNYEDLNQEGFIGLIKATKKFNYKLFPNFFVFANQWIVNGIKRSAKKHDIVYNPKRVKTVYCDAENLLISDDEDSIDEQFYRREKIKKIKIVVNSLPEKDKKIVKNLFGINNEIHTLRGSEKFCNLTYERIRQIKNKVLKKLKFDKNLVEFERLGE